MRYHIGCGSDIRKGYTNLDAYNPRADIVCDAREFKYERCEEVRTAHMLEHFMLPDMFYLLIVWTTALKLHGRLNIIVPDVIMTAQKCLYPFTPIAVQCRAMRCIFGSQEDAWAIHRIGFTSDILVKIYNEFGYRVEDIVRSGGQREDFPNYELGVVGIKQCEHSQDFLMRKAIDLVGLFYVEEEHLLHRKLGRELEQKFQWREKNNG